MQDRLFQKVSHRFFETQIAWDLGTSQHAQKMKQQSEKWVETDGSVPKKGAVDFMCCKGGS